MEHDELDQFKRMKKVSFRIACLFGIQQLVADFYHESTQDVRSVRVTQSTVVNLMKQGLLRVKHIVFDNDVITEIGPRLVLPVEKLSKMRAIDLVSVLVGLEETNPGVSKYQESDLQLDSVEVNIKGPSTQEGLNRFIALAPKELVIKMESQVPVEIDVSQVRPQHAVLPGLRPSRLQVKEIETVRVEVGDLLENEVAWPTFLPFLAASCPELRRLYVRCDLKALGAGGLRLGDWIMNVVHSLRVDVFPRLMRVCNADAVVNFEMRTSLLESEILELFAGPHPVLQLGEAVNDPDVDVSRSIAVAREEEQRAPWHIWFRIVELGPDDVLDFNDK